MADPVTLEFGDMLREARVAKGRSIGEVAATTRVQARYIEALEMESWQEVPGGIIGRGFVRVLAKELGGPSTQWVDAYRAARGEADTQPVHVLPEADWKVDLRGRRRPGPLLVAALVLAGCAAGVWIWNPWSVVEPPMEPVAAKTVTETPPAPEEASPPIAKPSAVDDPIVETPVSGPSASVNPLKMTSAAEVSPPSAEARLGIQAVERSWIRVTADQGRARSRVLGPGERVSYTARERFKVKFGNAGGVRLTWNDEALKVPGEPGQVTEIELPADLARLRP